MVARPDVLVFPDRKERGQFPVKGPDGLPVAHITTKWTGTGFTATETSGGFLCAGKAAGLLSRKWIATGSDGRPLLSVAPAWTSLKAEVALERAGNYQLRGSAWRRDFTVMCSDGTIALTVMPKNSSLFHPYDYRVRQTQPVFDLAELVAIVQIWRMIRKGDEAAAAVAPVTAAGALSPVADHVRSGRAEITPRRGCVIEQRTPAGRIGISRRRGPSRGSSGVQA